MNIRHWHSIQSNIIETSDYVTWLSGNLVKQKLLIVSSGHFKRCGIIEDIVSALQFTEIKVFFDVKPNPNVNTLHSLKATLAGWQPDIILAIGGGSVMDTAKIFARWINVPQAVNVLDLVETLPHTHEEKYCPLLAIPTTSGTGAEVTPFATLWNTQTQKKHSVATFPADTVLLDPSLTTTLTEDNTLFPALDALSHAMECIWNKNHNFISDVYAQKSIVLICENLPIALKEPKNLVARQALQQAAILSGLSIAKTKTALAHAMSYPLTLNYGVPHGLACSVTLLPILDVFGYQCLRFSLQAKESVTRLLESLDLPQRLEKYVNPKALVNNFNTELDPQRAANFLPVIKSGDIKRLLELAVTTQFKDSATC